METQPDVELYARELFTGCPVNVRAVYGDVVLLFIRKEGRIGQVVDVPKLRTNAKDFHILFLSDDVLHLQGSHAKLIAALEAHRYSGSQPTD